MAIGDVYQLTSNWIFVGQACKNVFHYELTSGSPPSGAGSCHNAWDADIQQQTLDCMADTCELDSIEVLNLMDYTDFLVVTSIAEFGIIVSGTSQTAASFVSFGYRLEKAHPGASNGYKRFPGVAEGYTAQNVYDPPAGVTATLETALGNPIEDTLNNVIYSPVVVKRPFSEDIPPTVWWTVSQATYTNLTTQSSRKF